MTGGRGRWRKWDRRGIRAHVSATVGTCLSRDKSPRNYQDLSWIYRVTVCVCESKKSHRYRPEDREGGRILRESRTKRTNCRSDYRNIGMMIVSFCPKGSVIFDAAMLFQTGFIGAVLAVFAISLIDSRSASRFLRKIPESR